MNHASSRFAALACERKALAARRPVITVAMPEAREEESSPSFLTDLLPGDRVEKACTVSALSLCAGFAAIATLIPQQLFDTIDSIPVLARFFSPF